MRRIVLAIAIIVVTGCTPTDSVELPIDTRVRVDVEEMDVSFLFREPLTLRASTYEALLSGQSTRMQVQTRDYGAPGKPAQPDGLGMWEIHETIGRRIREERSCVPLNDASVYLPVDTSHSHLCDMVLDVSGRTVLWMVGVGRPFEDVPFMQSALLVLEDDRYHVFAYVEPFPESDATVQWLTDTFAERNPNMSKLIFPNKSFKLLTEEAHEALSQQIEPPSAEVQDVMGRLRALAFSVGPSQALQGQ